MALNGALTAVFNVTEQKDLDLVSGLAQFNRSYPWTIVNGTGASQADLMFSDTRSLAQSANEDLDLAGVLAPLYGATVLTFVKLKAIGLFNSATSPGNITAGRGATNGFTWISAVSAGVVIPAGGGALWFAPSAGLTVTAGTADLINVATAATVGTYTYDVVLIGTSA